MPTIEIKRHRKFEGKCYGNFDYESVAREAKIPEEKLRTLVNLIRQEFPHDPMMAELHALRACLAVRDGHIQIDEALKSEAENGL